MKMKSKRSKWSGQGEFFIEMLIVNNWWSCLTIFWRKAPLMEDNFHPSIDHLFTAHDLGLDKPMDQFPTDTQSPHSSAYEEILV